MKALLAKEFRLVQPSFWSALVLVLVGNLGLSAANWLVSNANYSSPLLPSWYPRQPLYWFWFAAVMLALVPFGREFSLNTFGLLLAQPLERKRISWSKVAVASGALAALFAVWAITSSPLVDPWMARSDWGHLVGFGALGGLVALVGGLWTTLLLRQLGAAFWLTLLIPVAIVIVTGRSSEWVPVMVLCAYSVAGFLWAWRYFLGAQDVAWSGGVIALPGRRTQDAASRAGQRRYRPVAALLRKEIQLHQFEFAGMAALFLLHLGVVWLRRATQLEPYSALHAGLQVFGGLWLLVPLLVGSISVAEERKMGTLQTLATLPFSRWAQFVRKLVFVVLVGGVLSAVLLWTAEGIGTSIGAAADVESFRYPFNTELLVSLCWVFCALAFLGFYGSTLARSLVQALAAALVTTVAVWLLVLLAVTTSGSFGRFLWQGPLIHYVTWPVLFAVFLWLAWRNFRSLSLSQRQWGANLYVLIGTVVTTTCVTLAIYNRFWELLTPLEPAHGPAQFTRTDPPRISSDGGSSLAVLLPDRQLWVDRLLYEPHRVSGFPRRFGFTVGGSWLSLNPEHLLPGTNWVQAFVNVSQTVAIRSDGTLWASETAYRTWYFESGHPARQAANPLVQFGSDTNWQSMAQAFYGQEPALILLKRDGTLWHWVRRLPSERQPAQSGFVSVDLRRLGADSDWDKLMGTRGAIYCWKRNGQAWALHRLVKRAGPNDVELLDDTAIQRVPGFDNLVWRSLTDCLPLHAAVRQDGTLWIWTLAHDQKEAPSFLPHPPAQVGTATDWLSVAGSFGRLAALKQDGSIWVWDFGFSYDPETTLKNNQPHRLGNQHDWVAVGNIMDGTISVAADGTLWYWWGRNNMYWGSYYRSGALTPPLLAAPRRPVKLADLLRHTQPGGKTRGASEQLVNNF